MLATISANNKTYTLSLHAARRMLLRNISEQMLIDTIEQGTLTIQDHGTDLYEMEFDLEDEHIWLIIQVVVDEFERIIVSIIDDTEPKS